MSGVGLVILVAHSHVLRYSLISGCAQLHLFSFKRANAPNFLSPLERHEHVWVLDNKRVMFLSFEWFHLHCVPGEVPISLAGKLKTI